MNTKTTLIVSAGVVVSAGAILAYLNANQADEAKPGRVQHDLDPAALSEHTCGLEQGLTTGYAWRVTERARVDSAALGLTPAGTAPTESAHESRFTLTTRVLESGEDSAVLLGRMSDISSDSVPNTKVLEEPFLIEVTRDCQVTSFAYLSTTTRSYARHQQRFVFDMAWKARAKTLSTDTTMGELKATQETNVDDGVFTTARTAQRYDLWSHQSAAPMEVDSSSLTVTHSHRGLFEEARLHERFSGTHVSLERSAFAERVEATPEVLTEATTDQTKYTWENLLPQDLKVPRPDPMAAKRAKRVDAARGVPFTTALADHNALNEAEEPIHRAWPPLRDWLEANPEETHEVIESIKRGEMEDRAQMTAFLALGGAHTPEAKKELVEVMDDRFAPMVQRSRAILGLINRPDTGVELAETLSTYAMNIDAGEINTDRAFARQSMLALGAMSGYKTSDEDVRSIAERTVRQALVTTRRPLSRRPVFGALANIGDARNLTYVADIPSHPDKKMRKAAARVFRRMNPRKSDAFVASWLEREQSWQVKRELYDTLELQTFDTDVDPSDTILRLAMNDLAEWPGLSTRKSIILLLSRALGRRPADPLGIRPLLERTAAKEMAANSGLYIFAAKHLDPNKLLDIASAQNQKVEDDSNLTPVFDPTDLVPSSNPARTRRQP